MSQRERRDRFRRSLFKFHPYFAASSIQRPTWRGEGLLPLLFHSYFMTLPSKPFRTVTILVTAAAVLSACGGGGSSSAPAPTSPGPTGLPPGLVITPSIPSVALATAVPTPTYPAGSEELAAFNKLNEERGACGFGLLKQDSRLDAAAKGHADWQTLNGYYGHYQVAGTTAFTGVTPEERVVQSGYASWGAFEVLDEGSLNFGTATKSGVGVLSVMRLLNAPMHAIGMVSGATEVGIAIRSSTDVANSPTGPRVHGWFDLTHLTAIGIQEPPEQVLLTYPCEGRTGIVRQLTSEEPNPVPGRNLSANPLGSSVQLRVRQGQSLRLTTYAMSEVGTGASVVVRPPVGVAYNNEPYPYTTGALGDHETWIAADAPLKALTPYQVSLAGTVNGVAFSRQFVFTTGN